MPDWLRRLLPNSPLRVVGPVRRWLAQRKLRRRRQRFVEGLSTRLEKAEALRPITYDDDLFQLQLGGGQTINLINFWTEHRTLDAEQQTRHIESIAQGLFQAQFELPEDYEDVRIDLMPKVWARAAFDRLELEATVKGTTPPPPSMTPLGSHLLLGVVYDLPNSMKTIRREDLGTWEVTFYEAMEQAVENLRSRPMQVARIGAGGDEDDDTPVDGGLFLAMIGDSYDATRVLLVPDLVEAEQLPITGEPIAMMPCRDALLVTGSEDEDGLVAMAEIAARMIENEPRPLAPTLLRYAEGEWSDYHVAASHPAASPLHQLELRFLAEEYEVQKTLLQQVEAKRPQPLEVADLMIFRHRETDHWSSVAVWGRHVQALLPKSDYIALVSEIGAEPVYVTWDDVMSLTGELLEPVDMSPPRWKVTEFPHPKAIEILAEDAVSPMASEPEEA